MADNATSNTTTLAGLDPFDTSNFLGVVLLIGRVAAKFQDIKITDMILACGEYLELNPNATLSNIAYFLGASNDRIAQVSYTVGGRRFLIDGIIEAAEAVASGHLTHPQAVAGFRPVFWIMTILAALVIVLRLFSRQTIASKIGLSDWTALFAFLLTMAWGVVAYLQDVGLHNKAATWDRSYSSYSEQQLLYDILNAGYPVVLLAVKAALLVFYYQLSDWHILRRSVIVTAAFSAITTIAAVFPIIFQCTSVAFWKPVIYICTVNIENVLIITGSMNLFSDFLTLCIPMPLVWRLRLRYRERVLACAMFSLGALACVASVVRLVHVKADGYYNDGIDSGVHINIYSLIELNLGLICGSVPALRVLAIKHEPKSLRSWRSDFKEKRSKLSGEPTKERSEVKMGHAHEIFSGHSNSV